MLPIVVPQGGAVAAWPESQTVWLAGERGGLPHVAVSNLSSSRPITYQELLVGDDITAMGRVGDVFYLVSPTRGIYVLQRVTYDQKVYLPRMLCDGD
mgnify:CR=1 FL=1